MGVLEQLLEQLKTMEAKIDKLEQQQSAGRDEDSLWITTAQAADICQCSAEYIRDAQDKGKLDIYPLLDSVHRRVLRSELIEKMKSGVIKKSMKKK